MRVWGCLLLFAAVAAAQSGRKNPLHGDKDAIESGRGMFRIYCGPCHGIHATGGRGPDLTLGSYSNGDGDEDLYRVIAKGVAGTEMPDYEERVGAGNIWRLVAYIRSAAGNRPPPPAGDRAKGEKLFWGKGGCGACHRVNGRGNRSGPDLSRAGRQRSYAFLKESVLRPNAYLTPGANTITVVLKDGRTLTGVQRSYDTFSAQFMDTAENLHSYSIDEVKSIKRELRSMMPESYGKLFREAELDDLLAYLAGLR